MSPPTTAEPSVLRMAAPLVVSFVLRGTYTLVDTVYAAMIGDEAIAAIGLTVPFEFLMIALWVGLSTGLTSNLSRTIGSGESEKTRQYLRASWRLAWIVAPGFALCGAGIWLWAPRLGLEGEVARSFQIYGTVLVAGSAFTAFWSVIPDSLVKAHQDTRSTMWAGILSGTVNVLFNTLFLFVFHWGVFGIALSTCFGRVAGLVYALGRARVHERRRLREEVPRTGRDDRPYRALLRLAVPASLTFALMAGETALINWFLARGAHPTAAIAAYSIYYRVNLFLLNPIIAVGVAMLPYAARRFGRGDFAGIRRGLQEAGWASIAYCLALVAPLMWPLAPWLARVLCESDLTAEYTTLALRLVPLACLTAIPFMICRTAFEALQQWRPGLILAVVRYALLAAPAAWLGGWVAARNGLPELYGILAGLLGLAIGTSLVFLYWLMHYLRRCAASACIDPTAASGPHTPGQG